MAVHAAPAGLLGILEVDFRHRPRNRFSIGYTRCTHIRLYLELAQHPVDQDIQMQLPHARDDGLACVLVRAYSESGVFFGELAQRLPHLLLVGRALRLDRNGNDRLRKSNVLQDDHLVVAQRIARESLLEAQRSADIAGADLLDVLSTVGVHTDQSAHPLALSLCGVHHHLTLADHPRVDAKVGQPADVWIRHDLEDQGAKRRVVLGGELDRLLITAGVGAPNRGHVRR